MIPRFIRTGCAALLMAFPASSVHGESFITMAMRAEDPRLEQRVMMVAPRIYMDELLQRLSAQSGVSLATGVRDGSANARVSIHLKDVPLVDAMNALWSLMSYGRAAWHWERNGAPGKYTYRLTQPTAAQLLASRLRELPQALFEESSSGLLQAALLPLERRRPLVNKVVKEVLQGDEKLVEDLLRSERMWAGLRLFQEVLAPDSQRRVLRGQEIPRVPVDQLNEQGRAFVRSIWSKQMAKGIGLRFNSATKRFEAVSEPTYVRFETRRWGGGASISPSLFIDIEHLGGYAYLGGTPLNKAVRKRVYDLWIQPEDKKENPLLPCTIPLPPHQPSTPANMSRLERYLLGLAEALPLSLIARLPAHDPYDPGAPYNKTVSSYLERLGQYPPYLQAKWRNNMLLVTYPGWFWDVDTDIPADLMKQLRAAEVAGNSFLSLDHLMEMAELLPVKQLRRLATEFPVMALVADWRELFLLCRRSPVIKNRLLSRSGALLTEDILQVLRSIRSINPGLLNGTTRAVRLVQVERRENGLPGRDIRLEFLGNENKWIIGAGFRYGMHKGIGK